MVGPREWFEEELELQAEEAAERAVEAAELRRVASADRFKFSVRSFNPPELSHIRERALLSVTKRAQQALADRAQGVGRRLSPDEVSNLEDLVAKSDALIERVRNQNKRFDAERKARALLPRKEREAQLHRSTRDRTVAILGALERERRLNASLTRASLERAKARAASRNKLNKFEEGTLCHWWHNRKVMRKSVLIAKRLRRAPYSKFEDRHGRKHIKKLVMESLCGSA